MDIRHRMDWGPQYSVLVIKCEVLHLNENIMFRLNLLAYSQYVWYISFAP